MEPPLAPLLQRLPGHARGVHAMPDLLGRLAKFCRVLLMRRRQKLGFGAGAQVVGRACNFKRMLDADLAGFQPPLRGLELGQLARQLDALVGGETGEIAVAAQPNGGRRISARPKALLAIKHFDTPCALRFEAIYDTADDLDVATNRDGRHRTDIVSSKQRKPFFEMNHGLREGTLHGLEHVFDFSRKRVRFELP